jgi:NADPH-dependent 2,4-dienoyl-CoA reductase/sulfur reductase-like enzyme
VLRNAGVEVRLDERVTSLDDLAADVVVAGVGVTPRVDVAEAAGLAVDDGIVVDASYRTSAPSIFSAGDVARVDGRRVEHWHAAREGGEAVALAMLGEPVPPRPAPWVYSEFAGHLLDVVGYAPTFDEAVALDDGRLIAYLQGSEVAQLAIVDGALDVAWAREFTARRGSLLELEAWLSR